MSITTSPLGREQQVRTLPSAGGGEPGVARRRRRVRLFHTGSPSLSPNLGIHDEPDAGTLETSRRRPKIAVTDADVISWRGPRAASQDSLVVHKFTIVFDQTPGKRLETGIWLIMTGGPFPYIAEHLTDLSCGI